MVNVCSYILPVCLQVSLSSLSRPTLTNEKVVKNCTSARPLSWKWTQSLIQPQRRSLTRPRSGYHQRSWRCSSMGVGLERISTLVPVMQSTDWPPSDASSTLTAVSASPPWIPTAHGTRSPTPALPLTTVTGQSIPSSKMSFVEILASV